MDPPFPDRPADHWFKYFIALFCSDLNPDLVGITGALREVMPEFHRSQNGLDEIGFSACTVA